MALGPGGRAPEAATQSSPAPSQGRKGSEKRSFEFLGPRVAYGFSSDQRRVGRSSREGKGLRESRGCLVVLGRLPPPLALPIAPSGVEAGGQQSDSAEHCSFLLW